MTALTRIGVMSAMGGKRPLSFGHEGLPPLTSRPVTQDAGGMIIRQNGESMNYLQRRYGPAVLPILVVNCIIICAYAYSLITFGLSRSIENLFPQSLVAVVIVNLVPLYVIYDIVSYRIGFSDKVIYTRPLERFGPYLKMRFSEIESIDLSPLTSLGDIANAEINPSVIVLHPSGPVEDEIFALDPRRTNLKQFKQLVNLIYERRPEAFSADALRYAVGTNVNTPFADSDGVLLW